MLTLNDTTFKSIASLMYEACGLSFPESKRSLIYSRLSSRVQKLGLDSFEDYLQRIAGDGDHGEFQVAVDLLTTNETYFFREPEHYALLERELPRMGRRPLRVWSAASSFGDEAYSTAILMTELQQSGRIGEDWSILGTDISDRVLRSAGEAIYPIERLRNVTPERLKRYCLRGEGDAEGLAQIQPKVRERVSFGWLNLCRPIDRLGPFDVVFLRNVLIYFDPPTKSAVVDRVLAELRPGGLFFLGTAEGRVPCRTPLEFVQPGAFRKAGP